RHELDRVLGTAVDLGVAVLTAVAVGLRDGHAVHAGGLESLLDVVEPVRLDDRGHELHALTSSVNRPAPMPSYADSPWTVWSIPLISTSSLTRQPIAALRIIATTAVITAENASAMTAMMTCTAS